MARSRTSYRETAAGLPQDSARRAFLTFTAPAVGAAGVIMASSRAKAVATPEAQPQPQDDDGGSPTAHRQAYYRRARF